MQYEATFALLVRVLVLLNKSARKSEKSGIKRVRIIKSHERTKQRWRCLEWRWLQKKNIPLVLQSIERVEKSSQLLVGKNDG